MSRLTLLLIQLALVAEISDPDVEIHTCGPFSEEKAASEQVCNLQLTPRAEDEGQLPLL
jgi:hypothetical protein